MKTSIGVFAHQEQGHIAEMLKDLARQTLFARSDIDANVTVLVNGSCDATAAVARTVIGSFPTHLRERFAVQELEAAGKSRTWNHFIHSVSVESELLYCLDADIRMPLHDTMERMLEALKNTGATVVNSRPVKDIEVEPVPLNAIERLIVMGAGSVSDFRSSISGSLYLVRSQAVKNIYMPIGLPVEDGFLRAMLVTRILSEPERENCIYGNASIWHVYESVRSIRLLVRHQTRLVIGSAINTAIFGYLLENGANEAERAKLLRDASSQEHWLGMLLSDALPRWPYAFVPLHFLVERASRLIRARVFGLRSCMVAAVGVPFDAVVYVNAQWKMARGYGAGFW